MSNIKDIIPATKAVFEGLKQVFQLLTKKQYFAALKEFLNIFRTTYTGYIKGRFITVKGKKVPLAAVLAVAVILLYIIYPSSEETKPVNNPSISQAEMLAQSNYYNRDGIIIDKMHKCDAAVCGNLENTNDEGISSITIPVAFFDKEGILVYEGRIKATNVPVKENKEFQIPSEVPFDFFKLGVVIVEK